MNRDHRTPPQGVEKTGQRKRNRIYTLIVVLSLAITFWQFLDRINLLQNGSLETATIVKCDSKWLTSTSDNGRKTSNTVHTPVAITKDGTRVRGSLWWPSSKLCMRTMNREVTVVLHPSDRAQHHIVDFFQFWLFPALALYFSLLLLANRNGPSIGKNMLLTFAFIGIVLTNFVIELGTKPEILYGSGKTDLSAKALDRCISARVVEAGLSSRQAITYLICQNANISDLSSIADLVNLEKLYLQGNALSSLTSLPTLPKLKNISVANAKLTSLEGIENAPMLEELQANKNQIKNLRGVETLTNLKVVGMMMNQITRLDEFTQLSQLEEIVLNYNGIQNINPLANKPKLTHLQIYSNNVSDITPLYGNTAMKIVGIRGSGKVPCEQIHEIRKRLASDAKIWGQKDCGDPR
ncbi:MAG: hypothetical protein KAT25_01310 [Sulfuriflexus sp.]|nr:hypothetical protein [Sulfuriflexus sp.]